MAIPIRKSIAYPIVFWMLFWSTIVITREQFERGNFSWEVFFTESSGGGLFLSIMLSLTIISALAMNWWYKKTGEGWLEFIGYSIFINAIVLLIWLFG